MKLYEVAEVYKCDVTQDVTVSGSSGAHIQSMSAYFPLCSNENIIRKYGTTGLAAYKKAKSSGSYLTIYSKGKEVNRYKAPTLYKNIIGEECCKSANSIVRFELRIHTKNDLIALFKPVGRVLLLSEMLNCKRPLIHERLKKMNIDKEKILDEVDGFHETKNRELTEARSLKQAESRLAQERFIEILKMHDFDLARSRVHLSTEHNITPTQFTHILKRSKEIMTDFLLYRMPVATKYVLKMLEKLEH